MTFTTLATAAIAGAIAGAMTTLPASAGDGAAFPVTIDSCGTKVVFDAPPERVVSIDVNITETLLSLGLADKLVGYGGLTGRDSLLPADARALDGVPSISDRYPTLEVLLAREPDFVFAGWNYGFGGSGNVTPDGLATFGIRSYAIRESCARVTERDAVSIEDGFADTLAMGRVFGVEERAQDLIAGLRARLERVSAKVDGVTTRPRVFVYDSGDDAPFTAAALAMPNAIIAQAGGENIFDGLKTTWGPVNWEAVVARDPEAVLVIDYGKPSAAEKIAFLKAHPALQNVSAIRNGRFIVAGYSEATPGVRNVDLVERLARSLFPERF